MQPYELPFICSDCNIAYYHSTYLRSHLRSSALPYFRCAICQLNKERLDKLVNHLIRDEELANNVVQRYTRLEQGLPQYGVCIFIKAKASRPEVFRLYQENKARYLLGLEGGRIYEIYDISSKRKLREFLDSYIVFGLKDGARFIDITDDMAQKQFLLPLYVQECYRKEKETIILVQKKLNDGDLANILTGTKHQKANIKSLFLTNNSLERVDYLVDDFPNLEWLEISNYLSIQTTIIR